MSIGFDLTNGKEVKFSIGANAQIINGSLDIATKTEKGAAFHATQTVEGGMTGAEAVFLQEAADIWQPVYNRFGQPWSYQYVGTFFTNKGGIMELSKQTGRIIRQTRPTPPIP